jgi:thiamine-monophosphate kinase
MAGAKKGSAPRRDHGEASLIAEFARAFATRSKNVLVSIGDDAAVLALPSPLIWTIDDSVEGVHFETAWMNLGQAAARAFEAALSDVAAMGATPLAALSSLQVARKATALDLVRVRRAQASRARRASCPIVGGNVTRGEGWRFTTTLLGHVDTPVLRSSARAGHELWLFGQVGLAACGRAWLERGTATLSPRSALGRAVRVCVDAFRAPRALVSQGQTLDGLRHAAIDVSDGLAAESRNLAESSGVQVIVDEDWVRATFGRELVLASRALDRDPLAFALGGGEDYALLACGPQATRPRGAAVIGEVRPGRGALLRRGQTRQPLLGGFDHLR